MRTVLITVGLIGPIVLASLPAAADKLGEHPAIVAQRVIAAQGYDYASKFYPHPAKLYLSTEAPRPMMDHPAVTVAKREQQRLSDEEQRAEARVAALKTVSDATR